MQSINLSVNQLVNFSIKKDKNSRIWTKICGLAKLGKVKRTNIYQEIELYVMS